MDSMKLLPLTLLAASTLFAQAPPPSATSATCAAVSPEAAKLNFETVSIRAAGRGSYGGSTGGPGTSNPGRVTFPRIDLRNLMTLAYAVPWGDQISGPDWIVDSTNNGFAIAATMPSGTTDDEYCGMLRNLLATRLHLTFHHEMQPRPAYELSVAPGAPKINPYTPATTPEAGPAAAPHVSASFEGKTGLERMTVHHEISGFANTLGDAINRSNGINQHNAPIPRVTDKTGLTGLYDFRLTFTAPSSIAGVTSAPTDGAPDLFTALRQQLGLTLTRVKDIPVDVLVIDSVDQNPKDN